MGGSDSKPENATHELIITPGDMKGSGLDSVNASVTFKGKNKRVCEKHLTTGKCNHDSGKGKDHTFYLECANLTKISELTIRRDATGKDDEWYIEKFVVNYISFDGADKMVLSSSIFPFNRWLHTEETFRLSEFDSSLPQDDVHPKQRQKELKKMREEYILTEKIEGAPLQVEILPKDEEFSSCYKFDILASVLKMGLKAKFISLVASEFASLEDMETIYRGVLTIPKGINYWKNDTEFGNQKLVGCNPNMIELCKGIPSHMGISATELEEHLEKQSLAKVIAAKRLYMIDLTYLANIECSDGRALPGPTCLLYVRNCGDLVPIAIQIMPKKAKNNPVFEPTDPEYTWLAAKMWFNLADCSHHQSMAHLGSTHLLMESVAVVTNRQLSQSHPIYRLLAPHFLYLMNINSLAIAQLVSPGGWVDKAMHVGRHGMFNIIKRNWAKWNLQDNGNLVKDLKRRGVNDVKALPKYHYRDDGLLLWNAIEKYVSTVVEQVYVNESRLKQDNEIQAWCAELVKSANFKGIPNRLTNTDDLTEMVTVFIFNSSVQHAAVNFGQYDEYGFPPNYPASLRQKPPVSKAPLTEKYVVDNLPNKGTVLDIIQITKMLSEKGTNSLGQFEIQYGYDPIATFALRSFQDDLSEIGELIDERNRRRVRKYDILHPDHIPNAISI